MPDARSGRARYRRIMRFAARHLAVTWWFEILLPVMGLRRLSERHRARRMMHFARSFRVMAVELGGLMIKVGQYMSSRLDVLPPELTRELEGLQDEVPAVPFEDIRALAEQELGVAFEQVFSAVDQVPVAAASLGQVYRVTLAPTDAVDLGFSAAVIKVQRPGIGEIVEVDIAALRKVATWLSRFRVVNKRADAPALIEEFARTSREEIDYLHEAASAERFAANFADDRRVKVPAVAWERTTRQVLTLEDVTAIKVNDREGLVAAGIEPAEVAAVFAELMFDQLFIHGFVHADPHPGNLFVTPAPTATAGPAWSIAFVDFGMMAEVPTTLRGNLRALVIAAATRNGKGIVDAMLKAGVLLPSADTHDLERAMTGLFARFGGMGFAELREVDPREFREFAQEFGDVLLAQPFQLPEDFLLIGRAMSLMSGLCSSLDPSYNLWDSMEPYAAQLLRDEGGNVVGDMAKQAVEVAGIAWRLPGRVDGILTRLEDGELPLTVPRLEKSMARVERLASRLISAVIFAALLVAGARIYSDSTGLGTALMVASGLPLLHVMFGGRRGR